MSSLSELNTKRLKALYTALNAISVENRQILTEKYYTKNHQSNSDYKMAALKNMPVSHYRAMLREAQEEFCIFFGPLDQQIEREFEERLQQERESRNQKCVDHIAKRWSCYLDSRQHITMQAG